MQGFGYFYEQVGIDTFSGKDIVYSASCAIYFHGKFGNGEIAFLEFFMNDFADVNIFHDGSRCKHQASSQSRAKENVVLPKVCPIEAFALPKHTNKNKPT